MRFELGKYYQHESGEKMHIIGAVETDIYGWCFIGEKPREAKLYPIGCADDGYAQNWKEIRKENYQK